MRISVGELRGVIGEEVGRLTEAGSKKASAKRARKRPDQVIVDQLGEMLHDYVTDVGGSEELSEIEGTLEQLGAMPEQVEAFSSAVYKLEAAASEARASAARHNKDDWEKADNTVHEIFRALGIRSTLDDFNVYFPIEQWEEGMAEIEDEENEGPFSWEDAIERFPDAANDVPPDLQDEIDSGFIDCAAEGDMLRADGERTTWVWTAQSGWKIESDRRIG